MLRNISALRNANNNPTAPNYLKQASLTYLEPQGKGLQAVTWLKWDGKDDQPLNAAVSVNWGSFLLVSSE